MTQSTNTAVVERVAFVCPACETPVVAKTLISLSVAGADKPFNQTPVKRGKADTEVVGLKISHECDPGDAAAIVGDASGGRERADGSAIPGDSLTGGPVSPPPADS